MSRLNLLLVLALPTFPGRPRFQTAEQTQTATGLPTPHHFPHKMRPVRIIRPPNRTAEPATLQPPLLVSIAIE
jgi:hypothetical protein